MAILWLLISGLVAWLVGTGLTVLSNLGQILVPPQGLLLLLGLGLLTWLLHDDSAS